IGWSTDPFNPPSIPLAIRSPYSSAWLPQASTGTALNGAWATFWNGMIVGWAGYINVDGKSYIFMGDPSVRAIKATQKSSKMTPTQTIFVMDAGGVELTVSFLSPLDPGDLALQSFPFSYLSLSVTSSDGAPHNVSVYTDISAEWVTGNTSSVANWTTSTDSNLLTHQIQLADQHLLVEEHDMIQYGSAYFSTGQVQGLTYQTGEDVKVRTQFINNAKLLNSEDSQFRAVSDHWPVFALSWDLGPVTDTPNVVVAAIGHVRDPAVRFTKGGGITQDRSLYFWSQFSTVNDALAFFLNFQGVSFAHANAIDSQINSQAQQVSSDYAAVLAMSLRQAFAGTELTISKNSDGSFNTSDVLMFTKGGLFILLVSTVDVLYTMWPLFLFFNATFGKYALLPVFEATSQPATDGGAIHDLGAQYPQAIGYQSGVTPTSMPLEESGNMLIMTLSYTQCTGDKSLITTYFDVLDRWTQYLIDNTAEPGNQLSTDSFAGPLNNQVNLAIKGVVGIKAMSVIANLTGDSDRSSRYSAIAANYSTYIQQLSTSSDRQHLDLTYKDDNSWGLAYNLYADKLLGTNVFPDSVFSMETAWYNKQFDQFGVALDTRNKYTLSQWEIWTAAIVDSDAVRDNLISSVVKVASAGISNKPFGDWYDTTNGTINGFTARPVVGGHFALVRPHPHVSPLTLSSGCF
ncbi:DUF1793-domain-containing protein, partial [Cristinia sonorae]